MALQSRKDELLAAWRALDNRSSVDEGWRTISIASGNHIRILAGRLFPSNKESLLVEFCSVHTPIQELLPIGRGFTVTNTSLGPSVDQRNWIALSREASGGLELFTLMVDDIAGTVIESNNRSHGQLLQLFLSRIRAWQDFMQRGTNGILAPERELGLCGELMVLHQLIDTGISPDIAVHGWCGPIDGIQDFAIGIGAIEVKATTVRSGFPARINSLAQLDNLMVQPLFLAGVKFLIDESGKKLPDIICDLRVTLNPYSSTLDLFEFRLLHAGYYDAVASHYIRRFSHVSTRFLCVDDNFPKLARSNVDIRIKEAKYEIDLDLIHQEEINLAQVVERIGAI